ncbi:hypothetical protein [Allomesorhizobium alhagi]|uniref:Uncharacterized protein n=1 Tax=Mesorhizobium alhagi CCNWXJ12-2 TaxID=1107882 RepID=H0HY06_9HYPH|nr:hypothetical protein [Mesorhizobium alhagi]EHK54372.1 hypothetical protein MAXJ12_25423 [Mesorhizobium alhagi CCNWXJ12-2]
MGIVRRLGDPHQSEHALLGTLHEAAPLSNPEAARTAVFAALNGLVAAGVATWRERRANGIELRGIAGDTWLLDDRGVTRVR